MGWEHGCGYPLPVCSLARQDLCPCRTSQLPNPDCPCGTPPARLPNPEGSQKVARVWRSPAPRHPWIKPHEFHRTLKGCQNLQLRYEPA
jgi:hypothetical protein